MTVWRIPKLGGTKYFFDRDCLNNDSKQRGILVYPDHAYYQRINPANAPNDVTIVIGFANFVVADDSAVDDALGDAVAEELVDTALEFDEVVFRVSKFWHVTVDDRLSPLASVTSAH